MTFETFPDEPGEALSGGNVAAAVIRIGDTVRKPATAATPAVHAFLRHLAERIPEVDAPLGIDRHDRQVLRFAPGRTQHELGLLDLDGLLRLGDLVGRMHAAAAVFRPPRPARWEVAIQPEGHDLVVHHDIAPWNLVVEADRWRVIDADGAGPGSALWDLAYAVHGFVGIDEHADPDRTAQRMAAVVHGYGLPPEQRVLLVPMLARRTAAMRGPPAHRRPRRHRTVGRVASGRPHPALVRRDAPPTTARITLGPGPGRGLTLADTGAQDYPAPS